MLAPATALAMVTAGSEGAQAPEPEDARPARTHTVERGDTLSRIAARYGVPLRELFSINGLGARSILASPIHPDMQARLNDIKDREDFRPVAPVVLEEEAPRWFKGAKRSPFMLFVFDVRPEKADRNFVKSLEQTLQPFRGGRCAVAVRYHSSAARAELVLSEEWSVKPTRELTERLAQLCGNDGWRLIYANTRGE